MCQYNRSPIIDTSSSSTTTTSAKTNPQNEQMDFVPGPFDVICSQGKSARAHPGNRYLQSIVQNRAKEYAATYEKRNKSVIVRKIIETIQEKSPNGGFVKKDADGKWKVVTLEQAREKVSQSLRDTLASRYRSSLMSKKKSRMESNLKRMVDFDEIIGNNKYVGYKMNRLAHTIKATNSCDKNSANSLSDSSILKLMAETNLCILRQLKKDQRVQQKVVCEQLRCPSLVLSSTPSYSAVDQTLQRFHSDSGYMLQQPSLKRSWCSL